jgi:hypothetical protein
VKTKDQTNFKEGVDQSEFETSIKDALL